MLVKVSGEIKMKSFYIKQNIGGYVWNIKFVPYDTKKMVDGECFSNHLEIYIRNDLNESMTRVALTHEITHALLDTQGRVYQEKFNLEELCEFIAWNGEKINQIVNEIMSAWREMNK